MPQGKSGAIAALAGHHCRRRCADTCGGVGHTTAGRFRQGNVRDRLCCAFIAVDDFCRNKNLSPLWLCAVDDNVDRRQHCSPQFCAAPRRKIGHCVCLFSTPELNCCLRARAPACALTPTRRVPRWRGALAARRTRIRSSSNSPAELHEVGEHPKCSQTLLHHLLRIGFYLLSFSLFSRALSLPAIGAMHGMSKQYRLRPCARLTIRTYDLPLDTPDSTITLSKVRCRRRGGGRVYRSGRFRHFCMTRERREEVRHGHWGRRKPGQLAEISTWASDK